MSTERSDPETCMTPDYTGDKIYSELPPTCCAQVTPINNHKTEEAQKLLRTTCERKNKNNG